MATYNLVRDINVIGGLFIAPVVLIWMVVFVLSKNLYSRVNNFFGGYALSAAIYAFSLGMGAAAIEAETALPWLQLSSLISQLMTPLFLLFVLAFTRRGKWIDNFFTYAMTFGVGAILFLGGSIFTRVRIEDMYLTPLGRWTTPSSLPGLISQFWIPFVMLLGIIFCWQFYRKTKDSEEKKQALMIIIAGIVPLALGVLSQIILPRTGVSLETQRIVLFLFSLSPLITASALAYASLKYKLFVSITPSVAADTILETMKEALIVTDPEMNIEFVNDFTVKLLGYEKEELIDKPLKYIFSKEKKEIENSKKTVISEIIRGKDVIDIEVLFINKKGESIPVRLSSSALRNEQGKLIGVVMAARDVREIKELINSLEEKVKERTTALESERESLAEKVSQRTRELEKERKELAEKLVELEKFQKLAVGREMKMIELKSEIEKLKGGGG